ncbi:DUF746 domain-containing protein [Paraburkholderia rhynchosiae]|uniref:DUF746 domain-containing protein n=1 Tax=Paraburkholderia rhynchosiae TaxID=487049 RepID=A0A6J5CTG8_9BURK|nr:hypothetical protein LMG27174_07277 [Paraburkholderia rhynchosiae]
MRPCGYCGSHSVTRKGKTGSLPLFYCNACRRKFNRRTGTAFVRQKDSDKQRQIIRYLALPLPVSQRAAILDTDPKNSRRWIRIFSLRCNRSRRWRHCATGSGWVCGQPAIRYARGCGEQRLEVRADASAVCSRCGRIFSMRREVGECNGVLEIGPPDWREINADSASSASRCTERPRQRPPRTVTT